MVSRNPNYNPSAVEPFFHSRGYLPHFEAGERMQMITYRLQDSLPKGVRAQLADELEHETQGKNETERRQRIEEYLDKGAGSCVLQNESIANVIEQNLLHFDQDRYTLHAWVVMPNHVHVLLTPQRNYLLSNIVHSWKSYTAKKANAILGQQSTFWQREYFDRMIRSETHYNSAIEYIHNNPVKAGLCETSIDWQFSSARLLLDFEKG